MGVRLGAAIVGAAAAKHLGASGKLGMTFEAYDSLELGGGGFGRGHGAEKVYTRLSDFLSCGPIVHLSKKCSGIPGGEVAAPSPEATDSQQDAAIRAVWV